MTRFFAIGLVTFEVMHGGHDIIARFFSWANAVTIMPDHQQHLVRDHDLVVFDEITYDE